MTLLVHYRFRVALGIALIWSLFLGPAWSTALIVCVGMIGIPFYVEALIAAMLIEMLYGSTMTTSWWLAQLPILIGVAFLCVEVIRTFIREELIRFA